MIALADYDVFPQLLMPQYATWYALFARNRMVIAYTPKSKFASEITAKNWTSMLLRAGVETGRANPDLDPNGYRTLLVLQLAEAFYAQPGARGAAAGRESGAEHPAEIGGSRRARSRRVSSTTSGRTNRSRRPRRSRICRCRRRSISAIPPTARATRRRRCASPGNTPHDSVTFRGSPIVFALSIPVGAPHAALAARFIAYLFSPDGQRVLRATKLDVLAHPAIIGSGAPDAVARAAAP